MFHYRVQFILSSFAVCTISLSGAFANNSTKPAAQTIVVHYQPSRLVNGSPILFEIRSPLTMKSISAKWMDRDVFFSFDPRQKIWLGIAGVSLETHPGEYSLVLTARTPDHNEISIKRPIAIAKGKYRHISVTVARQFTEPSFQQLLEIKQERELKEDVFSHLTPQQEWQGNFVPPVTATISDVFGTARVFNGETQSMHQGLDYAVPSGTPVSALNRGSVLLARPLFFEGNFVVIDHGQGLLSLYMHLSKLEVKEGDQVTKGQEIALSGGTGRATGPHLHIAVRWQGIYVNPSTLMSLSLP